MTEKKIKSFAESGSVSTDVCGFILEKISDKLNGKIYLLVYKHHEVQIGMIENGQIRIDRKEELIPEYLKELRVFSENGELYIWKQNQELKFRLRTDDKGDPVYIYKEDHFMWGNKVQKDGCIIYEENRGMKIHLPFAVSDKQLPLKYRVWNYYDYDANGLIQFKDARLLCFLDKNGKEI